jgi:betaine-aldehyde dehydrogenase
MNTVAEHWIAGNWSGSTGHHTQETISPSTGELVGKVPEGGEAECRAAIDSAKRAFEENDWPQNPRLRAKVLLCSATRIEEKKGMLADLLSRETGKLLKIAKIEIDRMVSEIRYYAGLVRTISGAVLEIDPGAYSLVVREPAGVAGIIVPWNAPGILLVRALAPALAAGCTVVVKPALQSALFHTAAMKCFADVDLPPGAINSFCEVGSTGAEEMVRSPHVDVLSFTGSSAVGKKIMVSAAGTLKRLNLELGGKAPAIVFPDCDIHDVAKRVAQGGMVLCGQQCTGINRVLVHQSCQKEMHSALHAALASMRVGPVEDESTELGPLINFVGRDRIADLVHEAASNGFVLLAGRIPDGTLKKGAYITPSLLAVDDLASPIVQEEFFGPVMNIETFFDEKDAVNRANATRYGLAASVWTGDLARGHRIARALRSGTVWINEHNKLYDEVEMGGVRESGFGRLHGKEALNEFQATKHIYQKHGSLGC